MTFARRLEKKDTRMKPNIGLNDETRAGVTKIVNARLADMHVLYTKTRNYHWNIVGPQFHSLHLLFEEQYETLAKTIDETAERIRALGGRSLGTMDEFIKTATLKEEAPGRVPPSAEMVKNLLSDHEATIRQLREDIDTIDDDCHDVGTADFLTAILEGHEKMAWMLRAFVEGEAIKPDGTLPPENNA